MNPFTENLHSRFAFRKKLDILNLVKTEFSLKLARYISTMGIVFFMGLGACFGASGSERAEDKNTVISSSEEDNEGKNKKTELAGNSSGSIITDEKKKDTEETGTGESSLKETNDKKLKQEINTYIIESYKAQGNKIIKDLSVKLTKSIPNPEERKIAYEKIQSSLYTRIEQTRENEKISDMKREILIEFLSHLTKLLEKKISELE